MMILGASPETEAAKTNYETIHSGIFLSRPNRFIAMVKIGGEVFSCHVKNTGRCKELLIPGCTVWLEEARNPVRKTKYSLVAVQKSDRLINMDSQAPNKAAAEWLKAGGLGFIPKILRPESSWRNSRFDFYLESENDRYFMEVKGVTLEDNGRVLFPDAPTKRGVKHIHELCSCIKEGYQAVLLFVIQMENVRFFTPNSDTDPEFAAALKTAKESGVKILAMDCLVTPDSMKINRPVEVRL